MTEEENNLASPLVTSGLSKYMSFIYHRFIEVAVWTFAELGIADLIVQPITAAQLCQLTGWNIEFVYRLLRTCANADIVKEEISDNDNQQQSLEYTRYFQLTSSGLLLKSDHPTNARGIVRWSFGSLCKQSSMCLPQLIRDGYKHGHGAAQITGFPSIFEYLEQHENAEQLLIFNQTMSAYTIEAALIIALAIDFSRFHTLVDIGGSFGILLNEILKKHLKLNGILFDLSNVIDLAEKTNLFKHIDKQRYQFVAGNMFETSTIPKSDSYILKFILHDFDDEKAIEILKSIYNANREEKKIITLFIVEMIILPTITNNLNHLENWRTHGMDLHMLYMFGSKERTQTQYEQLLRESGFDFKKLYYLSKGPYSVIEATATFA
ncbi:unnamed protein product [Didymodactylos carnosus]|uniref:Acetylserotonin O-methyltransferase n=1 Tax=Didymodactylos carnosus TaxID=1234261 RepID=A0A8S2K2Q0_9BILA|nr:unnamed protein product [Didymodactylos carnosus]CAF3835297.1 unnamed protein product [Didymodactylos carnosus]